MLTDARRVRKLFSIVVVVDIGFRVFNDLEKRTLTVSFAPNSDYPQIQMLLLF